MDTTITGRKVLAIFGLGFGTIIAVNLTLAVNAVRTFPGLETKNSYVASQQFERRRAAQRALGWTAEAVLVNGEVVLRLQDAQGHPVENPQITATLGRATHVGQDTVPEFSFDGTVWRAPAPETGGNWDLRLTAEASDGTLFQRRLKLEQAR